MLDKLLLWGQSIDPAVLNYLFILSLFTLVLSLVLVPWLVARLPVDYFVEKKRKKSVLKETHPLVRIILLIGKNLLGGILFISGILMLVFPGQGILTILLGLGIMDFPGKFSLERKIINIPGIFKAMNWIRKKAGVEPLLQFVSGHD